ncbi:LexA family transcriptional regulator [Pseudomonas aeruginosa]|uniref:LexA family transcriptional regulator n=1 Tax=Pseudomonas aeruginosa TaxID=287 RepID=UPI00068D256A|nr:LexA family transcriptional regulator [Pseudomonas aeruginosa]
MKKKSLTEEQRQECLALKNLFLAKKRELKLTQEKAGELIGMTSAAVNHYLNGVNSLNVQVAAKFANLLGVKVDDFSTRLAKEIDLIASTTGFSGDKSNQSINHTFDNDFLTNQSLALTSSEGESTQNKNRPPSERDFVLIPVISIESGEPGLLQEHVKVEGDQALPRKLVISLGVDASKCVFIKSPDAGMEPYIFDGDLVLVDQSQREIIDKMVYAFIGPDSRVSLRRISIQLSGQVVLRSDNSDKIRFPDENVSHSEIGSLPIFGRVRWRMGGGGL